MAKFESGPRRIAGAADMNVTNLKGPRELSDLRANPSASLTIEHGDLFHALRMREEVGQIRTPGSAPDTSILRLDALTVRNHARRLASSNGVPTDRFN